MKVKDAWIPVRIEKYEDWYLVGLPKTSLRELIVRMLWKIYMVSSAKEAFVSAAKIELQPYLEEGS